jgi:hypothetical protein
MENVNRIVEIDVMLGAIDLVLGFVPLEVIGFEKFDLRISTDLVYTIVCL